MPRLLAAAALALGLSGAGAAMAADPENRSAIPLRRPALQTPQEAAGTGLAPEVQVRISIDRRGRVQGVEILKIQPRSDFDASFARATQETLLRWRYAPALHRGQPVPAEIEWTVQFPARNAKPEADIDLGPISPRWTEQARAEELWRAILTLPVERRTRLLNEYATAARQLLHTERRQHHESERFIVWTDAAKSGTAQQIATHLERTYDELERMLSPTVRPQPNAAKIMAVVYSSRESFQQLSRDVSGVDWASGFYNPAGLIAFHLEFAAGETVNNLLLHEATHAFVDRHVMRQGAFLPRWMVEGFAEYVGNSAMRDGRLAPGLKPRRQLYRSFWDRSSGGSRRAFNYDAVLRALRDGRSLGLTELLDVDRETFYGGRRLTYYTMSWLVVHFLRHGRETWGEREFPQLMLYLAEGYPAEEAFRSVYAATPQSMEAEFRQYLKRF